MNLPQMIVVMKLDASEKSRDVRYYRSIEMFLLNDVHCTSHRINKWLSYRRETALQKG